MENQNEQSRMTPMQKVEVLRAACCVAGINTDVSEKEKTLLDKIAKEVGVGRASLNAMIERASTDHDFHREQFRILKENPQQCLATVLEVAMADGKVTDNEKMVLQSLASNLEVPSNVFEKLMDNVSGLL